MTIPVSSGIVHRQQVVDSVICISVPARPLRAYTAISDADVDKLFQSFAQDDRESMTGGKQLQNILSYMHGCLHGQLNRVRQVKAEQEKK